MAKKYVVEAVQVCRTPAEARNEKQKARIVKDYPEKLHGKWYWQIGYHDSMGGLFGMFFIEAQSAERRYNLNCYEGWNQHTGEVFDTKAAAIAAGRKAMPKVVKEAEAREAEYAAKRKASNKK